MLGCECQIELPFFVKGDCYNGSQNSESLMLNHIKLVTEMMKNTIFQAEGNTYLLHLVLFKRYSRYQPLKYIFDHALFKLAYFNTSKKQNKSMKVLYSKSCVSIFSSFQNTLC